MVNGLTHKHNHPLHSCPLFVPTIRAGFRKHYPSRYNTNMEKEKPKVKTNIRQKRVAKELVENGSSVGAAMRKAGYSKAYAKHPEKLTKTKNWQDLMEDYLPDTLLAETHQALIKKKDKLGEVDTVAVPKGLDMAYKLKGKYAPEKHEHQITAVEIVKYGNKD